MVGLARVALEHADDAGAYLLAQQALTIDPENEAAQRMVARLAEVMQTRGETVPTLEGTPPAAAMPELASSTPADAAGKRRRSLLDGLLRRGR